MQRDIFSTHIEGAYMYLNMLNSLSNFWCHVVIGGGVGGGDSSVDVVSDGYDNDGGQWRRRWKTFMPFFYDAVDM
jgi:hypothetical protein